MQKPLSGEFLGECRKKPDETSSGFDVLAGEKISGEIEAETHSAERMILENVFALNARVSKNGVVMPLLPGPIYCTPQ